MTSIFTIFYTLFAKFWWKNVIRKQKKKSKNFWGLTVHNIIPNTKNLSILWFSNLYIISVTITFLGYQLFHSFIKVMDNFNFTKVTFLTLNWLMCYKQCSWEGVIPKFEAADHENFQIYWKGSKQKNLKERIQCNQNGKFYVTMFGKQF